MVAEWDRLERSLSMEERLESHLKRGCCKCNEPCTWQEQGALPPAKRMYAPLTLITTVVGQSVLKIDRMSPSHS